MFIVLESVEGAGKGTVAPIMKKAIEASGRECVHVRQPGSTSAGEKLREIFLWDGDNLTVEEEILLLAVDRKRAYEEIIRPALESGKVVICERWNATTVAYNCHGRSMGCPVRRSALETHMGNIFRPLGLFDKRPDLSILLNIDARVGAERIKGRDKLDRLELLPIEFMELVNNEIRRLHRSKRRDLMHDSRIVDASLPLVHVIRSVLSILEDLGLTDPVHQEAVHEYH